MTDRMTLTAAVKKAALDYGADLVSIGSIDRWNQFPATDNPLQIMPKAKSVICIAFRIHRGTLRGANEGTYYSAYTLSGFHELNRVIAPMVQHRLASFIEDHGYEAVPIMYYSHNLGRNTGVAAMHPDGTLKAFPEIFFDFRVGGVLCGMGEIGHSRLLLTPEFGPAQRIYFIVTEAELDADPILSGICDHCMECVRHCPAKALQYQADAGFEIPGVTTISRSSLDELKCRIAHVSGGTSPYAPDDVRNYVDGIINGPDTLPRPSLAEIKEKVSDRIAYTSAAQKMFHSPAALCGDGCIRACLQHLDTTGKLNRNR